VRVDFPTVTRENLLATLLHHKARPTRYKRDVTKISNGERGTGNGERETGNASLGTSVQR